MPEEKASPVTPPSRTAIACSSDSRVGFSPRAYSYFPIRTGSA